MEDHEEKLIESFIIKDKQERIKFLLSHDKRRKDFLRTLSHFKDFNQKFVVHAKGKIFTPTGVYDFLRNYNAPEMCYVVSENSMIDKKYLALAAVLNNIIGYGMGTIISCIPGVLIYYEGEDDRFFLIRKQ